MALAALLSAGVFASDPPQPECVSLLGQPLFRPTIPDDVRTRLEADLAEAERERASRPHDAETLIWVARRLGYLGRYNDAVGVLTRGLEAHTDDHRILRHRGHRFITLRRFDEAVSDLTIADERSRMLPDEIEPDGAPNRQGLPRSTTRFNILYHLALAHYLRGDFETAAATFTRCLDASRRNDDMYVAAAHWLVLARLRSGDDAGADRVLATIRPVMGVIENHDYHALLLLHRGERTPDDVLADAAARSGTAGATLRHGVGAYLLVRGDTEASTRVFEEIVHGLGDGSWPAFGFIAAEAELARAASD